MVKVLNPALCFFVAGSMKASMRSSNRIVAKRSVRALGGCVYSCLWLFALQVSALEYTEVTWGFDGHAVHDQFNLLTVVVRNSEYSAHRPLPHPPQKGTT